MTVRLPQIARRASRAAIVSVAALSLWSCTTAGNDVSAGLPAYDSTANATTSQTIAEAQSVQADTGEQAVPLPTAGAEAAAAAIPTPSAGDTPASVEDAEAQPVQTAAATPAPAEGDAAAAAKPAETETAVDPATAGDGSVATAVAAPAPPPKKSGLFSFFGSPKPRNAAVAVSQRDGGGSPAARTPTTRSAVAKAPGQLALNAAAGAPAELNMAALDVPSTEDEAPTQRRAPSSEDGGLPGVRQSALFDIKRRSGMDDTSDVDLYEDAPTVQMASVGGLGRGAHGLLTQHESVDVNCLKPGLVRILKQIEAKYGRKLVVTSGYRSPSHNRRARGAKNSQHMYCAAADIQVPGVGKAELARYVRAMPNRGGVGTYCHTNSIHVDVGPNRDWNWRCRGRRKR